MAEPLSFRTLLAILTDAFRQLPDPRRGENTQYTVCEAALGAFGVFFMQCPSFLAYQRDMQRRKGCNNAQSLFGVGHIPSDPQIRNLLDPIVPTALGAVFWTILGRLVANKSIMATFAYEGQWLCSLDGTQYFGSDTIHCGQCTVTQHDERTHYAHTALIPVLAKPGKAEVLVLDPEFITPQDGAEKQDCERNAAHRWIIRNAPRFAGQKLTILADDLHCNQPFCELLLAHHLNFIMTCKPDSHPTLYEEVTLLDKFGAVSTCEERVWTGHGHQLWTYRFVEHVPLREPPKALYVNWCELTIVAEATGEKVYHNAFATNHVLTEPTVRQTVRAGRARWKVENEGYNTLKNQGYHLEHNYGHGQQYLSQVLAILNLLAFLCHTMLQLCDRPYQRLRAELATRRTFFDDLRALTRYLFFPSWDHLVTFMITGLDMAPL
jgi:hypothetical protein